MYGIKRWGISSVYLRLVIAGEDDGDGALDWEGINLIPSGRWEQLGKNKSALSIF